MHNFWNWFRRSESTTTDGPLPGVIPPPRELTPHDPMSLGAVFRAVQILATAVSQLSIDSYRDGLPLDVQPSLVRTPDSSQSRSQWLSEVVTSLAMDGNAFLRVTHGPDDKILDLKPLPPHQVRITKLDGRPLSYLYKGKTLAADQIVHLKFLALPGVDRGLGPIEQARSELHGATTLRDYASTIFDSRDVPSGVLKSDQDLTQDQADKAKQRWTDTADGGVRVLGNGLSYTPFLLKADDAQYIETRKFTRTEIAGLFGIPAALMNAAIEGSSMTYSNIEQAWIEFIRFTLMAYLRPIEEALTAILPHGQTARFNLEALLRTDTTTRYAAHAMGLTNGFLQVEEVRKIENLPPLPPGRHAAPTPTEDVTA